MRSKGVKVFHVAANDGVIGGIPNDLVLNFLPSLEGLFNQDLGTQTEGFGTEVSKFFPVMSETRSKSSKRERRSNNDGVTNLFGSVQSALDTGYGDRVGRRNVDFCEMKEKG